MNFLLRNIFIFAVASFYTVSCTHYGISAGNNHIKRLYDDLLVGYNRLIRPVHNNSDRLTVYIRLKLSQIIDVDEKNQVMTVNVWVRQEWIDYKLTWNPEDYGGVQRVYIPSEAIWTPDIVLYNNADGNYETTALTKAALSYDGTIVWEPPAIYKSSCLINVEYFPFDEQQCSLVFGSWTYDGNQVDLIHKCSEMLPEKYKNRPIEFGSDLRRIAQNGEWDILSVPAMRRERYYPCCRNPVPELTFNITIRRRTLFYTVNLIIPCVGICFLTVLVFYLPSDSGEKVTLCISILLSLTLFFLLLAEIIPPTSMAIPLIGKYILFTMVLVTLSICVTVIVLNFHHRSPLSHEMPEWVRIYLLNHLPKLLGMQRYTHGYIKVAPPAAAAAAHEHDDNETYYDESVRRRKRRNVFSPAIIYQHPQQLSSSSAVTEAFAASSFLSNNNINHRRTDEDALTQSPIFLSAGWQHRRQAPSSFVDNDPTYMRYNFPSHDEHYDNVRVGNMRRGKTSDEFCYINQHERAQVLSSMRKSRTVDVENKEDLNRFLPTKQLGTASGAGGDKLSRAALLPARVVDEQNNKQSLPGPVVRSMNGLFYIASHIRKQEELCNVAEEWKFVAMALDRLFLWIFSLSCVVGSLVILLNSPVLYDDKGPLDVDRVYKNMTCYEIA